jgi:hypothetical protein
MWNYFFTVMGFAKSVVKYAIIDSYLKQKIKTTETCKIVKKEFRELVHFT